MRGAGNSVVADLLAVYQHAVRTGDRAGFAAVFHPDAVVSYPDRKTGQLMTVPATAFADEVVDTVAAGTTVEEITEALWIDVAGGVAVARVDFRLQIGDEHFVGTDLFSLAKLAEGWQICQKLYDMQPASVAARDRARPDDTAKHPTGSDKQSVKERNRHGT